MAKTQTSKTYAHSLYSIGVEFYQNYRALEDDRSKKHDFIGMRHYSLCHALELTLKGWLADTGKYNEQMLKDKKLGHDLEALAQEVEQMYGPFRELGACMEFIHVVNRDYKSKGYEYPINNGRLKETEHEKFGIAVNDLITALIKSIQSPQHPEVALKVNDPIPYVILGTDHDQNLRFYERYDENFLFNKVVTLLYILDEGESVIKQMEDRLVLNGGASFSERYLESIRAEIFFTALHQCETFFALLIAPFQSLPHWLYLTIYETKEIKLAVEQIIANKIGDITGGRITNIQEFIKFAIYMEVMAVDLQLASRWDENIDNVAWLVIHIGEFFLKYDRAYNSYKHGLRVMTGPHQLSIGLQNPNGTIRGSMNVIQASEDSVTYLQKEPVRVVDGEKEIPISEITKTFNPFEASFNLGKMSQMLETIKATRLTALKGGGPIENINTFFELDRDEVRQLAKIEEWKQTPMRDDEARAYNQFIANMRANAEQQKQAE